MLHNLTYLPKLIPALLAALFLTACETSEERATRLNQHNGKTVDQIIAVFGSPISHTSKQAVWEHRDSYVVRHPIREFFNGHWLIVGYDYQTVYQHCVLAVTLRRGIVVASQVNGTGCIKLVPRLPKG